MTSPGGPWVRPAVLSAIVGAVALYVLYRVFGDPAGTPETMAVRPLDHAQADSATTSRPAPVFLTSDPVGARVILDWQDVGSTPVTLSTPTSNELLVLFKPGYLAVSRLARSIALDTVRFVLAPDTLPQVGNAIVSADSAIAMLVRQILGDLGYRSEPEPALLARARQRAGGSLTPAMMSWARAEWHARLLISVDERSVARDLGEQDLPDRVRGAVAGTHMSDVTLEATVFDLRDAVSLGTAHGTGRGSAGDELRATDRARGEALSRLSEDLARLLSTLEGK